MKILKLISGLAIGVLILLVGILSFIETIEPASMKTIMLVGTILWFVTAPFWIKEEE